LATALAARGDEVHLVDNLSRGQMDADLLALVERPGVQFRTAELTDPAAFSVLDRDYDWVFHLAAIVGVANVVGRPYDVLAVNARTLLNALDWFVGTAARRFCFSSTSEAYGWTMTFHPLPIPTPEDVPLSVDSVENPRATYALSKVFGEMAVVNACRRAERAFTIVRYHNVYGPRMGMSHVVPQLYERLWRGQQPLVVYEPEARRAFCYVDDAIEGTLRLMADAMPSGVYNVGNDLEETSIGALARTLTEVCGVPDLALQPAKASGPLIPRRAPDIGRLRTATGFAPRVALREGLTRTVAWYRARFEGGAVPSKGGV
jgi:UDP-glucose 4-epimerase/UDP-glucuronate decarboxylase